MSALTAPDRTGTRAGRRVPARSCVGCRTTRPKRELIRLALPAQGPVAADPTGRQPGRGAYVCRKTGTTCLEQALRRRALARALRTTPDRIDKSALAAEVGGLTPPTAGRRT